MTGKLSVQLDPDRFDKNRSRESLGELLQAAAAITFPASVKDKICMRKEAMWIARWAVRAVCEKIIRTGKNHPAASRSTSNRGSNRETGGIRQTAATEKRVSSVIRKP